MWTAIERRVRQFGPDVRAPQPHKEPVVVQGNGVSTVKAIHPRQEENGEKKEASKTFLMDGNVRTLYSSLECGVIGALWHATWTDEDVRRSLPTGACSRAG